VVDGLHILIRNRKKNPLAMILSGVKRRLRGIVDGGYITNV
jgi:hypothetical protein